MGQFHWDPDSDLELVRSEVPDYERLQDEVASATDGIAGIAAQRLLELGMATGVTAHGDLARHPGAHRTGIDASADMLGHVDLPDAQLHVQDLGDPLSEGPFDVVLSAQLDGPGKAALFRRMAGARARRARRHRRRDRPPGSRRRRHADRRPQLQPARHRRRPAGLAARREVRRGA